MSKFKVGDLVYYPYENQKIFKLEKINNSIYSLQIRTEDFDYRFSDDGFVASPYSIPLIFHATPENHKALEQLYGVEFEKPPVKPTSKEIVKAMLARGDKYVCCWVSDNTQEPDHRCVCDLILDYDGDAASFPYLTNKDESWKYATPFDPRTGEPITELPE